MVSQNLEIAEDKICVLDFGGQYCHLIARRIRDLGVYSEIRHSDARASELAGYKGIILSGGPSSVYEDNAPKYDSGIFDLGLPILGICYGHQLIAYALRGMVRPGKKKEYGFAKLNISDKGILLNGFDSGNTVWMSHGDLVAEAPPGFNILASTEDCPVAAMGNDEKKIYGIQFHAEVTHTHNGNRIFENFLGVCSVRKSWDMKKYQEKIITDLKEKVNGKKVFMLLSGGVDSTVCFALLYKALPKENVYGLHIDNGFMRKDESASVKQALEKLGYDNFHVVDAGAEFLDAVRGIVDPEEKRKIIGVKFLDVQKRELEKLGMNPDEWMLGQGTIYPDTIESQGTKNADLIKTHHNRVALIIEMMKQGKVVEPLEFLYKDEVRKLGIELGLPEELVRRHPFPGPGLSIRCLCADKEDFPDNMQEVEHKIRELLPEGYDFRILPVKSVGVQGDARSYRHSVIIKPNDVPGHDVLTKISTILTNTVREINRVLLLVTPELKDLGVKESYLTKERLDILREADSIVNEEILASREYKEIWQFPIVMIPVGWDKKESLVLRPITSTEAMTANFTLLNEQTLKNIISRLGGFDFVAYDITNKPPATIEWE